MAEIVLYILLVFMSADASSAVGKYESEVKCQESRAVVINRATTDPKFSGDAVYISKCQRLVLKIAGQEI